MVRLVWLQLGRLESMTTKRELDPMQRKERKEEGKDGKKEEQEGRRRQRAAAGGTLHLKGPEKITADSQGVISGRPTRDMGVSPKTIAEHSLQVSSLIFVGAPQQPPLHLCLKKVEYIQIDRQFICLL